MLVSLATEIQQNNEFSLSLVSWVQLFLSTQTYLVASSILLKYYDRILTEQLQALGALKICRLLQKTKWQF